MTYMRHWLVKGCLLSQCEKAISTRTFIISCPPQQVCAADELCQCCERPRAALGTREYRAVSWDCRLWSIHYLPSTAWGTRSTSYIVYLLVITWRQAPYTRYRHCITSELKGHRPKSSDVIQCPYLVYGACRHVITMLCLISLAQYRDKQKLGKGLIRVWLL